MDTDSSLPPLLFLAVSLVLFGWTSVVFAARDTALSTMQLVAAGIPTQIRMVRLIRVATAVLAGISAAFLGLSLAPGWQSAGSNSPWLTAGFISIAALVACVVIIIVDIAVGILVRLFPLIARRVARPQRWFADMVVAPYGNGNSTASNGNGVNQYQADDDGNFLASVPLTPNELLNLDQYDIDMVRSISRMDDRDAVHIMVPRLDVDAVELSSTLKTVVDTLVASKHTRLPVYRGTIDDVVGIVHISDVLLTLAKGDHDATVASIMREPEFIAENMAVDDLLVLMRQKSLQMGIVVDEYGGVEGILTLEDVLEEIVGEIDDEFSDTNGDDPVPNQDGTWTLNATVPIEYAEQIAGAELRYGDVNTIGGYVYTELGRMPEVGDIVQTGGVTIEVTQVRGRRIQQLRLIPRDHTARQMPDPTSSVS